MNQMNALSPIRSAKIMIKKDTISGTEISIMRVMENLNNQEIFSVVVMVAMEVASLVRL